MYSVPDRSARGCVNRGNRDRMKSSMTSYIVRRQRLWNDNSARLLYVDPQLLLVTVSVYCVFAMGNMLTGVIFVADKYSSDYTYGGRLHQRRESHRYRPESRPSLGDSRRTTCQAYNAIFWMISQETQQTILRPAIELFRKGM
jgi:hypothetical protein